MASANRDHSSCLNRMVPSTRGLGLKTWKTVRKNEVIERLLYTDPKTGQKIEKYTDIPFYSNQTRIALRNIGKISQCDIGEYIAIGGYKALVKALTKMTSQQ